MSSRSPASGLVLALPAILALTPAIARAQLTKKPPAARRALVASTTVDPCAVASEEELRQVLELGIGSAFPIKRSRQGQHVTLSRPDLKGLDCPKLTLQMRVRVRYQKTRGIPQYSTTGQARLLSPVGVKVSHAPVRRGARLRAEQVKSAVVCLTDVDVIGLNLRRVPNWLDNTWIRHVVNERLSGQQCQDVTGWIQLYLSAGKELRAGAN